MYMLAHSSLAKKASYKKYVDKIIIVYNVLI